MTPETLAALRDSIEKWDKIADQTGVDRNWRNCQLCNLFAINDPQCNKCPVAEKTGIVGCYGTPFVYFSKLNPPYNEELQGYYASTPKQIAAARAMADFLRSLLPEEGVMTARYPVNCKLRGVPVKHLSGGRAVETENWKRVLKHIRAQEKAGGIAKVLIVYERSHEYRLFPSGRPDTSSRPWHIVEKADVDFIKGDSK